MLLKFLELSFSLSFHFCYNDVFRFNRSFCTKGLLSKIAIQALRRHFSFPLWNGVWNFTFRYLSAALSCLLTRKKVVFFCLNTIKIKSLLNPFDKDVSELPNKAENEPDSESVAQFEMYQKLKTAFLSAKIKDKPDNTLTSYCQG